MNKRSFDEMQHDDCKSVIEVKEVSKMVRQWAKNDIHQLISKGQLEVCKFLQSSNEYIEIIVDYLINSCMNCASTKITDVKQYFVSIMSCDENHEPLMQSLKNATHARSRCATKWHGKHVAYRCKTCQMTPSSCICVDCFNHSNHEGHDYVIYNSELGGCCDCGDELAFKSSGFCTRHCGKMKHLLPDGYRKKMYPVIHAIVCNFVYYLVHRQEYPFSKEVLHKLGKWLQKLSATHDGARHLVVEIFLEHSQYSQARPFKPDFLNLFMKPQQYKIPKPIEEILNKLENQKCLNIHAFDPNHDDIQQEDKLLKVIQHNVDEWRAHIQKRIKNVLVSIERGPMWKIHDFTTNEEEYHGISHEPFELQVMEAPPRKRSRLEHNKLNDENESDEEIQTITSSLYDEDSEHSQNSANDTNIPINNHEEPEIIYLDSNDDNDDEEDIEIELEDNLLFVKQDIEIDSNHITLELKQDQNNANQNQNNNDIFITKIGKCEITFNDLRKIDWNILLPKWLPRYDLDFYHEHIEENFLEDLIRADAYCDSDLTKTLTTLFLELMFDKTFKNKFASTFIKYYFVFTNRIIANPTVLKSLDKITVQILTQKELCLRLVQDHHLMEVLWDSAMFLFSSGCPKRVNSTDTKSMIKDRFSYNNSNNCNTNCAFMLTKSSDYWDDSDEDEDINEDIDITQMKEHPPNYTKQEKLIKINLTEKPQFSGLPPIVMDVTAKAFKDKLGRQVLQDIKFMLTHSACVLEMWKSPEIFDKYWYICGLLHGGLPHKRISAALLEPHKLRDREWQHAVAFDMNLSEVNQYIVDGMNCLYDEQSCMDIIQLLLVKLRNIIRDEPMIMNEFNYLKPPAIAVTHNALNDIQNKIYTAYQFNSRHYDTSYRIIDYPIAIYPVSIHIPLHRHLASYLKLYYDHDPSRFSTPLTKFLSLKYSVQLMEHPLRCIVFEVQTHTTLWKRNGLEVSFPMQFYRQPAWHCYSYDLDILLIQLCSMSIAANPHSSHIVIESLVYKFNLEHYFNLKRLSRKSWKAQSEYMKDDKLNNFEKIAYEIDEWAHDLSASFFRLIIFLSSPANCMFMNKEDMIRREMINNLCASDCSYTNLEDKMSPGLRNDRKTFDKILDEIAIYNKPNHNEQGSYTLKLKYWKEFDPFFYHFRPDFLTKAKQKTKTKKGRKGKPLTSWKELDEVIQAYGRNSHPLYPLVGNILYCNKLHAIIYCVLYTIIHEQFYSIRENYYNQKISLLGAQQINHYINSILDDDLFTLKKNIEWKHTHAHDTIAPQNDRSILNLQTIEPILRILWLAITTDSTYTQQRAQRLQALESDTKHNKFIYPFTELLEDVIKDSYSSSFCTDFIYEKELYPPHFPKIFKSSKQNLRNNKYLNVNYHDIALCLHPSNDILDNVLVLCDGPMSSLLHLLIILKFVLTEQQITYRIDEIIDKIATKSAHHKQLISIAMQQVQTFFNDRENSTVCSEDLDDSKQAPISMTLRRKRNQNKNQDLMAKKQQKKKQKKAKRLAKAKKKQQALLRKFKAKQQKFECKPIHKKNHNHKSSSDAAANDEQCTENVKHSDDSELSCVICCQCATDDAPLGRIVFLQHNLLPKFSRIPDGVADGHIQVLYQYVFDQKIKININELNKVLENHKIIRIEDFACESKENIIKLFKDTFKGRAQESLLEKAAETLHCRAKDLTHAQDRFLGLSHRTPSPVEQLIQLSQRLGYKTPVNIKETMDVDDTTSAALSGIPETQMTYNRHEYNSDHKEKEKKTMRCTTRDYYHTAYSLDIDVDRHRTINFEGDGGVQMLSCGHCLHIECYQRFLAHQMSQQNAQQNAQQVHPHLHLLDLQREFFCPLCRRLGNALLPISLDIDHNTVDDDDTESKESDILSLNSTDLVTSSSLPTLETLVKMYIKKNPLKEMPPLIRDSIDQLISNITRYSPGMQMIPNAHKSIEWLRFTLLFNIRLIENSLRYASYGPIQSTQVVNEAQTDYKIVTDHIYNIQKSFLNDNRLQTLYLLSRVIIFLSNYSACRNSKSTYTNNNSDEKQAGSESNAATAADCIQLERIIRGFFATGWVFDTSPLEIATRVLCMNWEYLPKVADKFDELCLTILLTYMGRIIYFLIRWSRATFDESNPHCLEFIQHLPKSHFIRFIHDVNIKRFNRHTNHIRKHKSYQKYLRSTLRSRHKYKSKSSFDETGAKQEQLWSEERILNESKWFINSIQWFCLPLLRHLAIMKHIIFKLLYNKNEFGEKIKLSADILSLINENENENYYFRKHNVTPSGKKVNNDRLILSPLRIVFEYASWSKYLLLPSIFDIISTKWNSTHLGSPYSDKHIKNVSRLSPKQQSKLLFEENPYWDKFIPPELLGIFRAPMSPLPFMLKRLPSLYQTLYTTILYKKCNRCQKVPNEAGLCLTCHRLICFRGDCCKNNKHNTFETYDHMMSCGGGLGGLVHLKMGSILLVAHKRRCLWHSLYLDEHGEEDKWLKRGHPLRISPLRFEQLEQMFVDGSFVHNNAELWVTDATNY